MGNGRLRVIRIVPGPNQVSAVVRQFCQVPEGVITAFSDGILTFVRSVVPEYTAEVKAFGEVSRKMLLLCGQDPPKIAAAPYIQAAVARACTDLDDDSPFHGSRNFVGTHIAIADALHELHAWGLDADRLDTIAVQTTDPLRAKKLESLSQIDRAVTTRLESLNLCRNSVQLQASFGEIPEFDGDSKRLLVIVGSEFSPLRVKWLQWAAEAGMEITAVFYRHSGTADLFAGANRAIELLDQPVEDIGDGNAFIRQLFAEDFEPTADIAVQLRSAPDPLAECEWAIRAVLDHGSPDDAAIYVRDLEPYASILKATALRFGVPLSIAHRVPLLTNAAARASVRLLKSLCGTDVRQLRFIPNLSYLRLSRDDQNRLSQIIEDAHRKRQNAWDELEYVLKTEGERFAWLATVLDWRRRAFAQPATSVEWHERLKELLPTLPWFDAADTRQPELNLRDLSAMPALLRGIAAYASVDQVGEPQAIGFDAFVKLAETLWDPMQITLPRSPNGLKVCSNPEQMPNVSFVAVLGMLEGVFPKRRSENAVLDDADREEISRFAPDLPRLANSHDKAREERDLFYQVCATANAKLYLSYPRTVGDKDNIPAYYLEVVKRLIREPDEENFRRRNVVPSTPTLAPDIALAQSLSDRTTQRRVFDLATSQAKAVIPGNVPTAFRINELADALECPFRYTFRQRLRIYARSQGARWYQLKQLPNNSTLASQASRSEAEAALNTTLEALLEEQYAHVPDYELRLMRAGGQRVIQEWVTREFDAREHWNRGETQVNVGFGRFNDRPNRIGDIKLTGTVPAVSESGQIDVVHLYKSSTEEIKEISARNRFELGLYMLAFWQPGRFVFVEVDAMNGKRVRYGISSDYGPVQTKDGARNLTMEYLEASKSGADACRAVLRETKETLLAVLKTIRQGSVAAIPGTYCTQCDHAELCRVSGDYAPVEEEERK